MSNIIELTNRTANDVESDESEIEQTPNIDEEVDVEIESLTKNVLNWEQVKKLDKLLNNNVPIHGRGNYPTLNVCLKNFIRNLYKKLSDNFVNIHSVRINGGVASYILAEGSKEASYSDIDIIFACDMLNFDVTHKNNCDLIKDCVFKCLLDYLPGDVNKSRINLAYLKDAYVMKMCKVIDNDNCWSLISLLNNNGQNIELKFVDKMKRQFQFSVDSFQIHLDSLLCYYDCQEKSQQMYITENFFPKVMAESVYGNYAEAKYHLDNKLIATKSPEQIRGGGLLKYCNLIVRGYKAADVQLMKLYEKYMCSRFFIDYNDINTQKYVLITYLDSHFQNDDDFLIYTYLMKLYEIVNKSTVCLMNHERGLTLDLIVSLAIPYQINYQQMYFNTYYNNGHAQTNDNNNMNQNIRYYQTPQQSAHIPIPHSQSQQQTQYYDDNSRYGSSCISSLSASPFHSPSQSPLPFASSSSSVLLSSTSSCSSPSPSPIPQQQQHQQNYGKLLNVNNSCYHPQPQYYYNYTSYTS